MTSLYLLTRLYKGSQAITMGVSPHVVHWQTSANSKSNLNPSTYSTPVPTRQNLADDFQYDWPDTIIKQGQLNPTCIRNVQPPSYIFFLSLNCSTSVLQSIMPQPLHFRKSFSIPSNGPTICYTHIIGFIRPAAVLLKSLEWCTKSWQGKRFILHTPWCLVHLCLFFFLLILVNAVDIMCLFQCFFSPAQIVQCVNYKCFTISYKA